MTKPTLKSELSQLFFTTIEMVSIPFYKIFANQANSSIKA